MTMPYASVAQSSATSEVQGIVKVLGGKKAIGHEVSTLEDLAEEVRAGLPYASLESVMNLLSVSQKVMGTTLDLPARTLARRQETGRLSKPESDRLYRVARVLQHAITVFEDTQNVATWMQRPNRALGGEAPLELLDTEIGVRQVVDVLGQIEHGIFS